MDTFTAITSGAMSVSVSSLLGKMVADIGELPYSFILQHLEQGIPYLRNRLGPARDKGNASPSSPLPQILKTPSKTRPLSSDTTIERAESTATSQIQVSFTNTTLLSIFLSYKHPSREEATPVTTILSTMDTLSHFVHADPTCNAFLLAQAMHLIITDIIAIYMTKVSRASTSLISSHSALQSDDEYNQIEGKLIEILRIFSSRMNYEETIIVLLNGLLRLQLLRSNYLLAFRSLLNYRVSSSNVSHPQLIRFYFYSSLILAIAGQHKKALKLMLNANQLFKDYSVGFKGKSQFSVDLAAFLALLKVITCTDPSALTSFESFEGMIQQVSLPDTYAVLFRKRTAYVKAQLAYLSRVFKRIRLTEICRRANVSEAEAKDYVVASVMDDIFKAQLDQDVNGECIVTIVSKREQLMSNKVGFREEVLQLVSRLSSIRDDLTRKDVLLSRENKKQDIADDARMAFDMRNYIDSDFSDSE